MSLGFRLLLILGLIPHLLHPQTFPVSAIPDALRKHANSVVRMSEIKVEVSKKYEMQVSREWAITVFNRSGNAHIDAYQH